MIKNTPKQFWVALILWKFHQLFLYKLPHRNKNAVENLRFYLYTSSFVCLKQIFWLRIVFNAHYILRFFMYTTRENVIDSAKIDFKWVEQNQVIEIMCN